MPAKGEASTTEAYWIYSDPDVRLQIILHEVLSYFNQPAACTSFMGSGKPLFQRYCLAETPGNYCSEGFRANPGSQNQPKP